MQPPSDTMWADIADAWAKGEESVAAMAARYRLFPARIYTRAKAEGWPARGSCHLIPAPAAHAVPPSPEASSPAPAGEVPAPASHEPPEPADETRAAMLRRLFRAIDLKLKQLEKRMSSGKAVTAADSERQTRELNQMIRSFEMVTEIARDRDNAPAGSAPAAVSAADAERMRTEIAERLERLARGRQPRG